MECIMTADPIDYAEIIKKLDELITNYEKTERPLKTGTIKENGLFFVELSHFPDMWGRRPKKFFDAEEWCAANFGTKNFRWYANDYTFYFTNAKDRDWFLLKWE